MFEYIVIGAGFAFAAAAQPGPLQVFLLSRVAVAGWKRTLPAALAPLISDGPIALLVLLLLHNVARGFESFLKGVGGIVLLYFAARTFLDWRRANQETEQPVPSAPRTLFHACAVNIVNPGPYIGWSLVLGPLVLEAWAQNPGHSIALILSFYVVMVGSLALFIVLLGTTKYLGPRGRRGLLLAASFVLAGIGIYSIYSAFSLQRGA
jgi:threonine/homoserine/homoserine lactone efflux protein